MKKDLDEIINVITGEASPEEVGSVNEWIAQSEENQLEFNSYIELWEMTEKLSPPSIPPAEKMWQKIDQKINEKEIDFSWIMKAAAVLLLALSGILLYQHVTRIETPLKETASVISEPKEIVKTVLATASGQKLNYVLPDGSIVYLNSESKIVYPKYFSGDIREIELTGEAFFSVKPDKIRPFIVNSGDSKVTVTGTEFNVRNRNRRVSVVVSKGSVNVLSVKLNKEENLIAGEMVEIARTGKITEPMSANMKYALAWRQNKLAFDHSTLREVMSEIERTFNVKVEFLNYSIGSRTITGIFESDSLEKILKVISLTLDINISQKGMKIIIQ